MECVASLDVLQVRGLVESQAYSKGLDLLERVVAMLTKLCELGEK